MEQIKLQKELSQINKNLFIALIASNLIILEMAVLYCINAMDLKSLKHELNKTKVELQELQIRVDHVQTQ